MDERILRLFDELQKGLRLKGEYYDPLYADECMISLSMDRHGIYLKVKAYGQVREYYKYERD